MLKSILVGLDGSPHSRVAVELGIRWAKRFDALVVGLGIIDEPTIRHPEMVPIGASSYKEHRDAAFMAEARRKVEQYLEHFALRCAEAQVSCKVLEDVGMPAEQITLEAQRYDVILLGRRTYFHFETQQGPDETLHDVVKQSPRPVITVPDSVRAGRCVMVAYDGSLQAARAVQAFAATGLDESQEVHVVCVGPDHVEATRHADRASEFLRAHDIKAQTQVVVSELSPGDVILDEVFKRDPGLLVMGAYGKPAWREFLFGSVTRTVLERNPVPLFLYH